MEYGRLSTNNKPVSRLVQGTIMAETFSQAEIDALFDAVLAAGINAFDTAHVYGDNGNVEQKLGRWMTRRGIRDELFIIGKGAHPNNVRQRVTPFDISSDIHDSLARLGTDYIDLYLLHRDNTAVPVGPIVERLHAHKQAGHILAYGGSNWSHERIADANSYAAKHGLDPFVASSPQFSLATQAKPPWGGCISVSGKAGKAARHWYAAQEMPLFCWSSLAGGFMSGRLRPDNINSFTEYLDKLAVEVYCFEENWARLARAEQLASDKGVSLPQLAIAYVLQQSQPTFALIACYTPEQVADNVQATTIQLSSDELAWLEGTGH